MIARKPVATIDIGSNSVRLVVYSGATRAPSTLFNEKVMAGLGRNIDETGSLSAEARKRAVAAIARFRIIVDNMGVVRTRIFATAAVREAANGPAFLDEVRRIGFDPLVLSGEEEARLAGLGVISGAPGADGIVGDLGGGSLELVDICSGEVRGRTSLPLGVLRLVAMREKPDATLLRRICRILEKTEFLHSAAGRPFYMVGGSWRSLARVDLALTGHPLPVLHQHEMGPNRPKALQRQLSHLEGRAAKESGITAARVPILPHANLLLRAIVDTLKPSLLVTSSFGVREGLLYDDLDEETRRLDPLIEEAREAGEEHGRFPQHGARIDRWISSVFDDTPASARIRLAACLLSDIAWAAHPDFRAERGLDMALHGDWVAIDAPGRVVLAQALFSNFGGSGFPYPALAALCREGALKRARQWGLAMRLAQRLSAGVEAPLRDSSVRIEGDQLVLRLPSRDSALFGEVVERRLKALAVSLDKKPRALFD
ncbi:MAG: Ppx/GppA family phosphatase [Alphaproteobacteria bacterium]|jgi:exopolyphosphatase/guanosine-5'-triphosphate,3'-diphosphate pyrophosphatase|nr:Ppx/GppA family phosphatase [Alphaproteobacteria bacterium]